MGRRLIVKPWRVERRWDHYQQQHFLVIYLRWPTYRQPDYPANTHTTQKESS